MTDVVARSEVTETDHHLHAAEIAIPIAIGNVTLGHLRLIKSPSRNLPEETLLSHLFEHPQLPMVSAKR
ncbi:hypothetical protein PC116_g34928 [Phytophthora cactorum]|nr:hypothetical protein PC116_g34928 [Phytophthora cactorum]